MQGLNDQPITGADRAYLDFYLGLRIGWTKLAKPLLKLYDERAAQWEQQHGRAPQGVKEVGEVLEPAANFKYFMWLQRHTQLLMKYGPHSTHSYIEPFRSELVAEMNRDLRENGGRGKYGTVEVAPELEMPAYYAETDFHLEKGGYWQDDLDAPHYDFGTRIHFAGLENVNSIHQAKMKVLPKGDYRRILEMGCGSGDSTFPLCQVFPGAEAYAIDLSAPFVKWAHVKAEKLGLPIHFSQQNAERTKFADESFDLVTTSMFFHELPAEAICNVIRESFRLLKHGGRAAFFTAGEITTDYGMFMLDWHTRVNCEPFMSQFFRMDVEQALREAGLAEAQTIPIHATQSGANMDKRLPRASGWRLITGVKP